MRDERRERVRESQSDTVTMTPDEAACWLREVGGELYRTPPSYGDGCAWVAVVRSPGAARGCGARLIVALGRSMQEATAAAAQQWAALRRSAVAIH